MVVCRDHSRARSAAGFLAQKIGRAPNSDRDLLIDGFLEGKAGTIA
jgi:hypothetical protein